MLGNSTPTQSEPHSPQLNRFPCGSDECGAKPVLDAETKTVVKTFKGHTTAAVAQFGEPRDESMGPVKTLIR
jgi:hypothetical protein